MFLSIVFYIAVFFLPGCARPPARLRALPDFALTAVSPDGAVSPASRETLRGRVWAANFVYTRCAGPCPMLTANMAALLKRLPPAAGALSFTVDPDRDSPPVLAAYARRFGADPRRWLFVGGRKEELVRLLRGGFHIAVAEDASAAPGRNVAHTTKFVLIDAAGWIRGYYDGDDPAALDRLAADAARL